jgi:hypothetical protein
VAPITCSTVCPGGDPSLPSAAYTPQGWSMRISNQRC